jgi:hypothetical protein
MKSILGIIITSLMLVAGSAIAGEDSTHRLGISGTGQTFYEAKSGHRIWAEVKVDEQAQNVDYDANQPVPACESNPAACQVLGDQTKTPFYNLRLHNHGEEGEAYQLREYRN